MQSVNLLIKGWPLFILLLLCNNMFGVCKLYVLFLYVVLFLKIDNNHNFNYLW